MSGISLYGFWLFMKLNIADYLLMKTHFAFLDYSRPAGVVLAENLSMLLAWAFLSYLLSMMLKAGAKKKQRISFRIPMKTELTEDLSVLLSIF